MQTATDTELGTTSFYYDGHGQRRHHHLFGLDLIHVDDGSTVRTVLGDGLGSGRVEMVGGVVDSATTYEPYGKVLAQSAATSSSPGTVYGFTGEQYDALTGQVYLRARYYNPGLKVFTSRDPFSGWARTPASQHGYSYVHNNPVNYIDPTGQWCLLVFSVGPGPGCSAETLQRGAQLITFLGGLVSSPAFATGFLYEFVDSIAVSSLSITSGIIEVILKDTQIGRTAAYHLGLALADCGVNPDIIAAILSPYSSAQNNPDPYFQLGRMTGRLVAVSLGLGTFTAAGGGTAVAALLTGGTALVALPVTASIAASGAIIVSNVIAKEITDPLLLRWPALMSAAWEAAGAEGSNGQRFTELSTNPKTGRIDDTSIEEAETILQAEKEGLVRNARRPDGLHDPDIDFRIDGGFAEVKRARSPIYRSLRQQAADISGTFNHYDPTNVTFIVDLKELNSAEKIIFRQELQGMVRPGRVIHFVNQ